MGFSRQEYWSGVPFPSPGDLPHTGIKPAPTSQADSLPLSHRVMAYLQGSQGTLKSGKAFLIESHKEESNRIWGWRPALPELTQDLDPESRNLDVGVEGFESSGRPVSSTVPSQAWSWGEGTHVYPWHRLINKSTHVLNPMEKVKSSPVKKKKKKPRVLPCPTCLHTFLNPHKTPGGTWQSHQPRDRSLMGNNCCCCEIKQGHETDHNSLFL